MSAQPPHSVPFPEMGPLLDVLAEALADRVAERVRAAPADELVAIAAEPLAALGLEYRPILELAQAGTLRSTWIGRRRYTRRAWLVELADKLPAAEAKPVPVESRDELRGAVQRAARRKSRKPA